MQSMAFRPLLAPAFRRFTRFNQFRACRIFSFVAASGQSFRKHCISWPTSFSNKYVYKRLKVFSTFLLAKKTWQKSPQIISRDWFKTATTLPSCFFQISVLRIVIKWLYVGLLVPNIYSFLAAYVAVSFVDYCGRCFSTIATFYQHLLAF